MSLFFSPALVALLGAAPFFSFCSTTKRERRLWTNYGVLLAATAATTSTACLPFRSSTGRCMHQGEGWRCRRWTGRPPRGRAPCQWEDRQSETTFSPWSVVSALAVAVREMGRALALSW